MVSRKILQVSFVAPFFAILGALALHLYDPLPLRVLRNASFDQYQRWQPRPDREVPVQIVDIDDQSLQRLGQWPWPRTRIAELVQKLQENGAAVIALDIIFAEPDRTSPRAAVRHWGLTSRLAQQIAALPDHDDVLARTIAGANVVLGFAVDHASRVDDMVPAHFRIVTLGTSPLPALPAFSGAIRPLAALEKAAAGSGAITFNPDSDGVVRRVPMMFALDGALTPSFSAEALRLAQGARNYILKALPGNGTGLAEVRIGAFTIPTTPGGEAWIHYREIDTARYLPAWKILSGQVADASLRGKIILVGTSAQGLMDLRASPLGGIMPGIEAHAQMLEQALTGHFLERPSWAVPVEALVILLGGFVLAVAWLTTGALVSAALAMAAAALAAGASWLAFVRHGLLLDPVMPVLSLALAYLTASVLRHVFSERRQRWVKAAFSRYVSPNLVTHLVDNPGQLELGGRRQACSFVFTDLAGFTGLMEKMDPGQAVSLLNDYLDRMINIAFRHEGTLDRIVGDAVAIMFSAPVEQADHPRRAVACALEMHRFASAYANALNAKGVAFGQTRIGVHTGEVIVGNFGGPTIFDYRALGDPVNTASRLESLNKHLGTWICISEATRTDCPDVMMRPVGDIILKGKSQSLKVFEPLLTADGLPSGLVDREYEAAYALLAQRDAMALDAFAKLHEARPADRLVAFHLERLRKGEHGMSIVMTGK